MGGSASSIRQGQDSEKLEGGAGHLHDNDMVQSACEIGDTHSRGSSDEVTNSTTSRYETKVTDLDLDSLVICASNLALRDLTNMAMTCQRFRDAAYSDTVWEIQCRLAFLNSVKLCLRPISFIMVFVSNVYCVLMWVSSFHLAVSASLDAVLVSLDFLFGWNIVRSGYMRPSSAIYLQILILTSTEFDGHQSSCAMGKRSSIAVAGMHIWHDILQLNNYVTQTLWTCICTCYQCLSTIFCLTMTLSQSLR